jgi:hypothetical protein
MFFSDLRRMAIVLCVLALVVFVPSLAFGQPVDPSDPVAVWAAVSAHPASPLALGYALLYGVELLRKVPKIGAWLFERVLTTDLSRRIFVAVLAHAPALALVLTEHMTWGVGLRTALLTFAVSQWRFLSAKMAEEKPATVPPLPLLLMALFVIGCGVDRAKIEAGLDGAVTALDVAKPCLVATQDKLEAECAGDAACISGVRDHFQPIADAYEAFGALLCAIDATAEGCSK